MEHNVEVIKITDPNDPILDTLSQWIYQWWGKDQHYVPEQMKAHFQRSVFENRLPQTFAALKDGVPVGCFQFSMSDTFVRPDLFPWIKNVYVDHPHRGQGIAKEMLAAAVEYAKSIGLSELYLFTHLIGFYEQFGWEFQETFDTMVPETGVQRLYKNTF